MNHLRRLLSIIAVALLALVVVVTPATAGRPAPAAQPFFIDTDIGADDALAIAWLMDQPAARIVGFSTVAGNTSVENATRNLLTLFAAAGRQYPVTVGAAEPLVYPATRTGALVHGPDGFWFAQQPIDISGLPTDAPAAIAAAARANPDLTIIALGPLTNIALAYQQYPSDLAGVRVIALGGAQRGGNRTPVSEFNIHADPQALEVVLGSGMMVDLVTLDAFDQVEVDGAKLVERLTARGGARNQLLAAVFGPYVQAQQLGGTTQRVAVPDAAAVIYALRPALGTPLSALITVITGEGVTRGQTVIATDLGGRIPLLADEAELSALAEQAFTPGFDLNAALFAILQRRPDNAQAILDVEGRAMARLLERGLLQ